MHRGQRPSQQGFTLIELMIVIVIIGILAAIAIPNYLGMRDHSREAQVKGVAHTVQLAAEDYAVQNDGAYSDAGADLLPLLPGGALLENAFTLVRTEPQFASAAAAAGQVGILAIAQGGVNVGYRVNGFGKTAEVIQLTNGS